MPEHQEINLPEALHVIQDHITEDEAAVRDAIAVSARIAATLKRSHAIRGVAVPHLIAAGLLDMSTPAAPQEPEAGV